MEQQLETTQNNEGWLKPYQMLNRALFAHLEHHWTYYILDLGYIRWKFITCYLFWIKRYLLPSKGKDYASVLLPFLVETQKHSWGDFCRSSSPVICGLVYVFYIAFNWDMKMWDVERSCRVFDIFLLLVGWFCFFSKKPKLINFQKDPIFFITCLR